MSEDASSDVQAIEPPTETQLLCDCLQNLARGPKTLRRSWEQTQAGRDVAARPGDPAQVFLAEGGFDAWLALTCANAQVNSSSHFRGKASLRNLLDNLGKRPPEAQKLLASEVAAGLDTATKTRVADLYAKMQQPPPKKRRT